MPSTTRIEVYQDVVFLPPAVFEQKKETDVPIMESGTICCNEENIDKTPEWEGQKEVETKTEPVEVTKIHLGEEQEIYRDKEHGEDSFEDVDENVKSYNLRPRGNI